LKQTDDPIVANVPWVQNLQVDIPTAAENPAEQFSQNEFCDPTEKVPAEQSWHFVPPTQEKYPAPQLEHEEDPLIFENLPD
jgi:hypothetical protein